MATTFSRTLPKGWRIGQFWFNFFEWLHTEKGYALQIHDFVNRDESTRYEYVGRMADPFYIRDDVWEKLMDEYFNYLYNQKLNIDGT